MQVQEAISKGIADSLIIKSMIESQDFAVKCFSIIKNEPIFDKEIVNTIYRGLLTYYNKYKKPPNVDLLKIFTSGSTEAEMFLENVNASSNFYTQNPDWMMDLVKQHAQKSIVKRAILAAVSKIDTPNEYEKLINEVKRALEISFDTYIGLSYRESMEERIAFNHNYADTGISTGISAFDEILQIGNGLLPKNIYIIAAESNLGKSIVLCNIAASAANNGKNVLFISLEMQEYFIAQRIDAKLTSLPINRIYSYENEEEFRKRFSNIETVMTANNNNLWIKEFPPRSINVNSIKALLNDLKEQKNFTPDLVVVDYLNIMRAKSKNPQKHIEIQEVVEELRALAIEENVPVLTASQINRGGYGVDDPELDNMADSMGIVMTADFIAILSQNDGEKAAGQLMFHVRKSRLGGNGMSFVTSIDYNTLSITDCDGCRVGSGSGKLYNDDD